MYSEMGIRVSNWYKENFSILACTCILKKAKKIDLYKLFFFNMIFLFMFQVFTDL